MGAKKRLDDGIEFKNIIAFAIPKALKMNKISKTKATDNSNLEDESEYFNYKNLDTREDFD